jgi:tRNA (cmo5U34)-methyltransferase
MKIPTDWTFRNTEVAKAFDRHVREQLPWYEMATGAVSHLARHFIPEGGMVYDIGASTGNVGRALAPTLKARSASLVAIESVPAMAARYQGPGSVEVADACTFDYQPFDVAVMFLVLMFVKVSDRKALVLKLAERMNDGGAVIIVDKVHPPPGWLGTVFRRLTLAGKVATRTPAAEIVAKELSLSGVQRPLDDYVMPFPGTHEFFRFGEFVGWVITKSKDSKYGF